MALRLSGLLADRPAPNAAVGAFYFATDEGIVYDNDGNQWTERAVLDKSDVAGYSSGLDADKPTPNKALGWVYHAIDTGIQHEAFPTGWFALPPRQLSLLELRQWLSGRFGTCLHSTGAAANLAQNRILLQTVDASPTNPCLVYFDQFILNPFTGPGQFDLVERDASDVDVTFFDCITVDGSPLLTSVEDNFTADMVGDKVACAGVPDGTTVLSYQNPKQVTLSADATADAPDPGITCVIGGKTEVTIATKAGFTDGDTTGAWSRLVKVVMADKVYSIVFVPGTAGDGIYSAKVEGLNQSSFC